MTPIRAIAALAAAFAVLPAQAQVMQRGYVLPLDLAVEAASEAVRACAANGYPVTATVVDVSGVPQVVLRGDHSCKSAVGLGADQRRNIPNCQVSPGSGICAD